MTTDLALLFPQEITSVTIQKIRYPVDKISSKIAIIYARRHSFLVGLKKNVTYYSETGFCTAFII